MLRMAYRAEFEQWVAFPVEQVFLFFANPENLPRIMPPSLGTRIENLRLVSPGPAQESGTLSAERSLAGVSSEIVTSFRVVPFLPFRKIWTARITEFQWNGYFVDVQARGPFRSWTHRHEVRPEVRDGIAGTSVRDQIEYEIGFGFMGALAQTLFVRQQMKTMFARRQSVLERLLREG